MAIVEGDVLFWHDFSEGSGTSVNDETSNNNDITLVSSPSWGTSGVPSGLNGYVDLDGTADYGTLATDDFDGNNDRTCCAWINPDTTNFATIFSNRATNTSYFYSAVSNIPAGQAKNGGTTGPVNGATSISTATWYFLCWGWDSSGTELWLNDASEGTDGSLTTGIGSNGTAVHIGQRGNSSQYFDGQIAQTMGFNKKLTLTEVQSLYASGNGETYSSFFGGGPSAASSGKRVITVM